MWRQLVLAVALLVSLKAMDLKEMQHNVMIQQKKFVQKQAKIQSKKVGKEFADEFDKYEYLREKHNSNRAYLIYFTSNSLDGKNQLDITNEIAILNRKNGMTVKVKPLFRGLNDGVFKYGNKLRETLKTYSPHHLDNIKKTTLTIGLDHQLFLDLNITKVPSIATAICKSAEISKDNCNFYYKITGETSIQKMMSLAGRNFPHLYMEHNDD